MAVEAVQVVEAVEAGMPGWSRGMLRAMALAWALVVALIVLHQWQFWREQRLDNDVLAMLPADEQSPRVAQATKQLADRASREIVVLLGAADAAGAQAAARRFEAVWRERDPGLLPSEVDGTLAEAPRLLQPWRDRLLTEAQREQLSRTPPEALAQEALAALYRPGASARLGTVADDPLGLWSAWWQERLGTTRARPVEGFTMVADGPLQWVVLRQRTPRDAFSLDGDAPHGEALQAAEAAARQQVPGVRVLKAGVPLHAEAAAAQASREVNVIGWGSLAAIALLLWLTFRSPRPLLLVAVSLAVGVAAGLSATALLFERVHLITLVFGATLVGVAEDYGIHYFAGRAGAASQAPGTLMKRLWPGMALAMATSVLGYLVLAVAPFPGLRQMAVFSGVGLAAAFFTVACWFPWADRRVAGTSRWADAVAGSLARWPRLNGGRRSVILLALLLLPTAWGLSRLKAEDDVRQLQSSPPELLASQREVARLLGLPSPAQFVLVEGMDAEQVLQREEALKPVLRRLQQAGVVQGHVALSDWVPSRARQQADAALTARVEQAVLAQLSQALGESLQRPAYAAPPLQPEAWLKLPMAQPLAPLWLGTSTQGAASVVMLQGLTPQAVPQLEAALQSLPGVRWVDRTAQVSALMARYRVAMGGLLVAGFVLVLAVLAWRWGRMAWRAWAPAALACVFTLALLGAMGEPLRLFNVLALFLLLGIGVDYGIFLLEHRNDGTAWLAVVLGAASTVLSFGLLALSATPALRAFGLTMLFGTTLVWALAPLMRPPQTLLH